MPGRQTSVDDTSHALQLYPATACFTLDRCSQGELHEGVATTRNAAVDIAATRLLMAVVGKAAVKAAGIQDPLEAASRQYAAAGLSGSSRLYSTD